MLPVEVHTHIAASRDAVFDMVADLAARPAYMDHWMTDYRLTRPRSTGIGAAARFKLDGTWGETAVVEALRPRRVREEGRMGRLGGTRTVTEWDIESAGPALTRVALSYWTEPAGRVGALREGFGARRSSRRKAKTALERLRRAFENERDKPLVRASIAGWEPGKAARHGSPVQVPGARPGRD